MRLNRLGVLPLHKVMPVASIDIGTNTILLLIAEWDGTSIRVLRDEARIARLGEGLHQEPFFTSAAQKRALNVLKDYRALADRLGAQPIWAVGTAACRKAKNAPEFVARVLKETGIAIQIISGEEEARLSFLCVEKDFGHWGNVVALDIGGGSTEIISKEGGVSFNLGTVILTESIVKHDPPTEKETERIKNEIDRSLTGWVVREEVSGGGHCTPTKLFRSDRSQPVHLVGLAGSVTTLSAIKQKLTVWDGTKVQGSVLTSKDIDVMMALFQKTTNEEKQKIPGMVAGREDTLLAGTLILQAVMKKLGTDRVIVSDRGLRFGLLYDRAGTTAVE